MKEIKNMHIEVHIIKPDDDEDKYISELVKGQVPPSSCKTCNSACPKDKVRGYYLFRCVRSGQTFKCSERATGCKAFMSFKLRKDWLDYKVIVQRTFSHHNDHDPQSQEDGHFQRICPEIITQIKERISLGVKPDIILLQAHTRSRSQGHSDL